VHEAVLSEAVEGNETAERLDLMIKDDQRRRRRMMMKAR
jgi:hypothetical protein